MRNYSAVGYQPIKQARIGLGQFSPFISPFDGMATPLDGGNGQTPAPAPGTQVQEGLEAAVKTTAVLSGLALTGLSAATAYVGISFGSKRHADTFDQIAGWTVGIIGALSGIVRLVGTGVLMMAPPAPIGKVAG